MKKYKLFALVIGVALQGFLIGCYKAPQQSASASASFTSYSAEAEAMAEQEKAERQRLEQEMAEQQRLEEEKAKQQSLVGTYEIDDGHLGPIVLTVNDDKTATIRYKNDDIIYYGDWYKYEHMEYAQFHFEGEQIYVNRPKAVPQLYIGGTSKFLRNFALKDGYLYTSSSAAKAKNPNERIEYKRMP